MRIEIYDAEGKKVWRTFNLRYVRHIDEDACRVMMNGARQSFLVVKSSMARLVEAVTTDVDVLCDRIAYLQSRVDDLESTNNYLLGRLSAIVCRPWWKRILGVYD